MADLTFYNGVLYGANSATTNLYAINTANGLASPFSASGVSGPAGVGLAADSGGTIYGTPNGASGDLVIYNSGNGVATTVAPLSGAPFTPTSMTQKGAIDALAFNSSDVLFGVDINNNDATRSSDLVTINTATGAVTDVGPITDGEVNIPFFDALAFTAVPQASTWIASSLAAGLLIIQIVRARSFNKRTART